MKIVNFCILLSIFGPVSAATFINSNNSNINAEESQGMTFSSSEIFEVDTPYQDSINTFEAVISLPKSITSNAGTILGSKGVVCGSLNFDISTNGNPKVYSVDLDKQEKSIVFDQCDVRSDSTVHLAITNDSTTKKMSCYLNGELVQTKDSYIPDFNYIKSFVLGGDWRDTTYNGDWRDGKATHAQEECLNSSYFKGTLYEIALYSSVRNSEEIKNDIEDVNDYKKELFAHYEFNGKTDYIANKAGHDYNINKRVRHLKADAIPELKDYEYSIAVIGDTQYTCLYHPEEFEMIFDDLREHVANNKLKYVISMGDNCDKDTDEEWSRVQEQYKSLDGLVGYAVNQGNHESSGQINKYFSNADYLSTLSGCYYNNNVENSYRFLNVGDVKYIIFTLEYGASESVLEWAGDICDSFPDHKVICSTHGYLTYDGTSLDRKDADVPTKEGALSSGDDIWNNFYSQHKNIVLTLCGHISSEDVLIRQENGVNGNMVTSMLVDNQANDLYDKRKDTETGEYVDNIPLGMIYYLYFSKDGSHVQARYYSPVQDEYMSFSNQREITLYDGVDFETESIQGLIKDDTVTSVTFDKESYNVGDLVSFNVALDNKYEIVSILVNNEPVLTSSNENYAYCYTASKKDCVEITTALKLEYKLKESSESSNALILPVILISAGVILLAAGAFVFIKKKH